MTLDWFPEWHYIEEDDYPDENFIPLLIEVCHSDTDDNGELMIAYWRSDSKWWESSYCGWLPKQTTSKDKIIVKRWSRLPASLYNLSSRCNSYVEKKDGTGRCLGTKEIDACKCGGIPRYCDFYDYMRRR